MTWTPDRREFLKFIGANASLLSASSIFGSSFLTACASLPSGKSAFGIQPSFNDELLLAQGLRYQILCTQGDAINSRGETFGFNNDFTCFIPFQGRNKEGLLWVNHESLIPEFLHKKSTHELTRSIAEITKEREQVGGSILHLKLNENTWEIVKNSTYNRRLSGTTPIPFSHGYKIMGSKKAIGTLANCAGGLTPWNTFLTSEENYDEFYGSARIENRRRVFLPESKLAWYKQFNLPPEHYGWVVEINPYTGKAEKQILLGRAAHEGATVVATANKQAVVYMGEDRPGGFIYKFVSTGMNFKEGTLYAADTQKGRWLALDIEKNVKLKNTFSNQLEVLMYSHQAAEIVGATPQDRPEDIEVHPTTGEIFITLTKNPLTNNKYGGILKLKETKDYDSLDFASSIWLSGGIESSFACPDNLCFDRKGNLWFTVDMSEEEIGTESFKTFGNNGLFYVAFDGPQAGIPIQVASSPVDAELTGPSFSDDGRTLFLSVQHPGVQSRKNIKKLNSHWPKGGDNIPQSAVVMIQGELLDQLTGATSDKRL